MPTGRITGEERGKTAEIVTGEGSQRVEDTLHCSLCGYVGPPDFIPNPSESPDFSVERAELTSPRKAVGCPICWDGAADPWALIREVRALLGRWNQSEGLRTQAARGDGLDDQASAT